MRFTFALWAALVVGLAGCAERPDTVQKARVLTMGDSLLATHRAAGAAVSDRLETLLAEPVVDRSLPGARVINVLPVSSALGLQISRQYVAGDWDWIVLNGGGNDLWLGCGCFACDRRMTRMISTDGQTGRIVDMVRKLRAQGARVIYVGYLRSPGFGSPIEHCKDEGDALEARLAHMANTDDGVYFLTLQDMVPPGDRSFHAADRIHPSRKASAKIAERIARIIQAGEGA